MLANLNEIALARLLELYNVWEEGMLPVMWKEAVIIPVKKQEKLR